MGAEVTAPARISQADIERAAKACKNAGWTGARITIDLASKKIDLFLGDAAGNAPPQHDEDDDYD
jgi:hypothetical protein